MDEGFLGRRVTPFDLKNNLPSKNTSRTEGLGYKDRTTATVSHGCGPQKLDPLSISSFNEVDRSRHAGHDPRHRNIHAIIQLAGDLFAFLSLL
ncbi:hypothetical protein ACFLQ0_06505, partial [Nitrospinota bacterium]